MSEENKKIILNKSRNKMSVNADTLLDIDINNTEKKLPADKVGETINEYEQYIKEKDGSNKYRFVFTMNPVCSNVLFNRITEIVKDEGTDGCCYFGVDGQIGTYTSFNMGYIKLKGLNSGNSANKNRLTRDFLIRDTGLSHPDLASSDGLVYHCGYDIFNNHYFRNLETVLINKAKYDETGSNTKNENFNEIGDYVRDYDGTIVTTLNGTSSEETPSHIFFRDTTRSYVESIEHNLIERNGWLGFINPAKTEISNFAYNRSIGSGSAAVLANFTINKCLNNNKACEFIDMYPDRSLYSFIPKVNKYRKRNERNWDYCITYPYKNYTNNELITFTDENEEITINGLKSDFTDSFGNVITDIDDLINYSEISGYNIENKEYRDVLIRTNIRNNIKNGDNVIIHLVAKTDTETPIRTINVPINVKSVGLNGYANEYFFSVNASDLMSGLLSLKEYIGDETGTTTYCYTQRIADGKPCKYYFRVFKRLPNFKNSSVNNVNTLTDDIIQKYCLKDFSSSLNKLGFGENVYGDRMAQIVIDDDLDTTNIYDNLGRPITELFLTVVKSNRGNTLWYKSDGQGGMDKLYSNSKTHFSDANIEFSHCFSDVTSGVEIPWVKKYKIKGKEYLEQYQYNIHGLHNLPLSEEITTGPLSGTVKSTIETYPVSSEPLEKNIIIQGTTNVKEKTQNTNGEFLGDICELSENTLTEYVLENVCHRFNTMQRENVTMPKEFGEIPYDEIKTDDYDSDFKVSLEKFANDKHLVNVAPEGYYYKPHYSVKVREFDDTVYEGYHTKVNFDKDIDIHRDNGHTHFILYYTCRTDKNYYFEKGDDMIIYSKKNGNIYHGVITEVEGDEFRDLTFNVIGIKDRRKKPILNWNDYVYFKPNILKPVNAYELNDGSGKYVWRVLKSAINISSDSELYDSVFTNGCHYFHKNINFFLRRQDPFGDYWLNSIQNPNVPSDYRIFDIVGNEKDMGNIIYFKEGETDIC